LVTFDRREPVFFGPYDRQPLLSLSFLLQLGLDHQILTAGLGNLALASPCGCNCTFDVLIPSQINLIVSLSPSDHLKVYGCNPDCRRRITDWNCKNLGVIWTVP